MTVNLSELEGAPGCRAAVRAPFLAKLAQLLLGRLALQAHQLADFDLHRQVAGRPDIGAAFREQQIDFGRPAADALDLDQLLDRLLVVLGQVGEVELARQDQLREAPRIAGLLPRQPGLTQSDLGQRPDRPRRVEGRLRQRDGRITAGEAANAVRGRVDGNIDEGGSVIPDKPGQTDPGNGNPGGSDTGARGSTTTDTTPGTSNRRWCGLKRGISSTRP